ncbi:MAG: WYL domain-containing protein [Anaerolineae bacterium]|nr:WYL domain-containing protein [Anaerolineae bacterium]
MNDGAKKADRILQIEALLLQHPEGLRQSEIARRLGVNRSTIFRYLPSLPGHVYIDDLDENKIKIYRDAYLVNVRFNIHEATAMHLATRLLTTSIAQGNPHAASAMRKLAVSLETLVPHLSHHMARSADEMDAPLCRAGVQYRQVLEALTLSWAGEKKCRIFHQNQGSNDVFEYSFCPYFIEPYAPGFSIHVIGLSQSLKGKPKLRTFKLERIHRVELTQADYQIPDDFDPYFLMKDAWGIWYTDREPVLVKLRFSPRVAVRIQATIWHPSQNVIQNKDGSVLWEGWIAEPTEMKPWIRGWGADVEVLEPEKLRGEVMEEVISLARVYGWVIDGSEAAIRVYKD